jgi:hypothetical protein
VAFVTGYYELYVSVDGEIVRVTGNVIMGAEGMSGNKVAFWKEIENPMADIPGMSLFKPTKRYFGRFLTDIYWLLSKINDHLGATL